MGLAVLNLEYLGLGNELEIWVSDRAWTNSFCTLASLGAYEDFMPGIEYDVLGGI